VPERAGVGGRGHRPDLDLGVLEVVRHPDHQGADVLADVQDDRALAGVVVFLAHDTAFPGCDW
jgi:hypothetical protein